MAHPPRSDGTGDDQGVQYEQESAARIPRWVKVAGIVAAILVLLFLVMMLAGGPGRHNPLRHTGERGTTSPAGLTENRHTPPIGVYE